MFLDEVLNLTSGLIITFDKGYVDYAQYEAFTQNSIWYITRLKENKKKYENSLFQEIQGAYF